MYTFQISTGKLSHNGALLGTGWAGHDAGRNNVDMQNVPDIGPLPCGKYKIGKAYHHPKLGPFTMDLTPDPANEMYGRSLFRMHGAAADNPATPINEFLESSHGCIIQMRPVREKVDEGSDRDLEVVE